jgi:hypothetical protein
VSDGMAAAFLRSHPNVEQTSLTDPYQATAQTVRYMGRLVQHSLSDPVVFQSTDEALRVLAIAGSPSAAIWHWVKRSIKFVHHQELLRKWLGKGDSLQLLISPEALLKMESPKGDCAVFTTLIAAMLQTAGIQWEIVTVACDRSQPGIFSHVFPRAVLPDGRRLTLDASHGKYPGWEVPKAHRWPFAVGGSSGTQVWNQEGEPISDQDSGYRGLGGFDMGMGCADCEPGLAGYSGLGDLMCSDTDANGNCISWVDSAAYGDLSAGTPLAYPPSGVPSYSGYPSSAPGATAAPMTAAQSAALANLATQWTKIAGGVIAPTTTIQTPSGLNISTPAGQTSALSSLFGGGGLSPASSAALTSYMPMILLAGAALLMFSFMGKK